MAISQVHYPILYANSSPTRLSVHFKRCLYAQRNSRTWREKMFINKLNTLNNNPLARIRSWRQVTKRTRAASLSEGYPFSSRCQRFSCLQQWSPNNCFAFHLKQVGRQKGETQPKVPRRRQYAIHMQKTNLYIDLSVLQIPRNHPIPPPSIYKCIAHWEARRSSVTLGAFRGFRCVQAYSIRQPSVAIRVAAPFSPKSGRARVQAK